MREERGERRGERGGRGVSGATGERIEGRPWARGGRTWCPALITRAFPNLNRGWMDMVSGCWVNTGWWALARGERGAALPVHLAIEIVTKK